jgi:hypothetical protein
MVGWKPRTLVIATRPLILVVDVGSGKTLGCRCSSVHLTGSGCSEDPPKGTTANQLDGGALTIGWARAPVNGPAAAAAAVAPPHHPSSLSYTWIGTEEMEARVFEGAPRIGFCHPPICAGDCPIEMDGSRSFGLD